MEQKQLLGKILIQAELTVETGLHIGGSNDYAPIGAVDSVFVRDPFTRQPIIPGSSVKGKMRTLLAKARNGARMVQSPAEDEKVVRRLLVRLEKSRCFYLDCNLVIYSLIEKQKENLKSLIQTLTWGKLSLRIPLKEALVQPCQGKLNESPEVRLLIFC